MLERIKQTFATWETRATIGAAAVVLVGNFLPQPWAQVVQWAGLAMSVAGVVSQQRKFNYRFGPQIPRRDQRQLRKQGYKWNHIRFQGPDDIEIYRLPDGEGWQARRWFEVKDGSEQYRGPYSSTPQAALLAAHLDNWGQ